MMGAGDFAAGLGPAGHGPVEPPSPAPGRRPPGATLYDGAAAGPLLDARGQYRVIHDVDQRVALALIVREGDIVGAPGTGSRLRKLGRMSSARVVNAAENAVRFALAEMLAKEEITLLEIVATTPSRGKLLVTVKYKNNLLQTSEQRVVRAVL